MVEGECVRPLSFRCYQWGFWPHAGCLLLFLLSLPRTIVRNIDIMRATLMMRVLSEVLTHDLEVRGLVRPRGRMYHFFYSRHSEELSATTLRRLMPT